jgi:hypothetical protein
VDYFSKGEKSGMEEEFDYGEDVKKQLEIMAIRLKESAEYKNMKMKEKKRKKLKSKIL